MLFTHYLFPAILLHLFFDHWDASHWLLWSKHHHWLYRISRRRVLVSAKEILENNQPSTSHRIITWLSLCSSPRAPPCITAHARPTTLLVRRCFLRTFPVSTHHVRSAFVYALYFLYVFVVHGGLCSRICFTIAICTPCVSHPFSSPWWRYVLSLSVRIRV